MIEDLICEHDVADLAGWCRCSRGPEEFLPRLEGGYRLEPEVRQRRGIGFMRG